jgi:formylglycine-generating enzyme required for sulfatase activity
VGGLSPGGDGKWGHADLAGNVFERVLDMQSAYVNPCNDCVNQPQASNAWRVFRGGGVISPVGGLVVAGRSMGDPTLGATFIGVRCARAM